MNATNIVCSCGHSVTMHKNNGCNYVTKPKIHPYEGDEFCTCDVTDRELFVMELAAKDGGLNRLVRYLINEALVEVDDMPNNDAPDEAVKVISDLQQRVTELESQLNYTSGLNKTLAELNTKLETERDDFHDALLSIDEWRKYLSTVDASFPASWISSHLLKYTIIALAQESK